MQFAVYGPGAEQLAALMKFTVAVCIRMLTMLVPPQGRLEDDTQTTVLRDHWHGDIVKGDMEIKRPTTHN